MYNTRLQSGRLRDAVPARDQGSLQDHCSTEATALRRVRFRPEPNHAYWAYFAARERFSGEFGTSSSYQCRLSTAGIHQAAIARLGRLNLKGSRSGHLSTIFFLVTPLPKQSAAIRDSSGLDLAA